MWVLYGISPTTFNVVSDVTGQVVSGIFILGLSLVYPYMVWNSVKRGNKVVLDSILAPPGGFLEAIQRIRQGDSMPLIILMMLILLVTTFAHAVADLFLEFVTVEVGSSPALFLSSYPGGVPMFGLLADEYPVALTDYPVSSTTRLNVEADRIAKGLSRFSSIPTWGALSYEKQDTFNGLVSTYKSRLVGDGLWGEVQPPTVRPFPNSIHGRCQEPVIINRDSPRVESGLANFQTASEAAVAGYSDNITVHTTEVSPTYALEPNVFETTSITYSYPDSTGMVAFHKYSFLYVPECDYESPVDHESIAKDDERDGGWEILDWTNFFRGPVWTGDHEAFGARDDDGHLHWWIDFSFQETRLAFARDDDWQFGRRVRDGLILAIGIDTNDNATHWNWDKPYHNLVGGVEFQVDFSVLSGPGEGFSKNNKTYYTLSSWSENCPVVDSASGTLNVVKYPTASSAASGCIVNTLLETSLRFPADTTQIGDHSSQRCTLAGITVTTVGGVQVDPYMLAAYAGIATRNKALNGPIHKFLHYQGTALNSVAAAYIVTREVVPGTVAIEGVRARINPGYLVFMALPLAFLLCLLLLYLRHGDDCQPIPRSIWDILVLGRSQIAVVPMLNSWDEAYPECPDTVMFGLTGETNTDAEFSQFHLGLEIMERSLRRFKTMKSGLIGNARTNEEDSPNHSTFPSTSKQVLQATVAPGSSHLAQAWRHESYSSSHVPPSAVACLTDVPAKVLFDDREGSHKPSHEYHDLENFVGVPTATPAYDHSHEHPSKKHKVKGLVDHRKGRHKPSENQKLEHSAGVPMATPAHDQPHRHKSKKHKAKGLVDHREGRHKPSQKQELEHLVEVPMATPANESTHKHKPKKHKRSTGSNSQDHRIHKPKLDTKYPLGDDSESQQDFEYEC